MFLLRCASDVTVSFEDFSITWQNISWRTLHYMIASVSSQVYIKVTYLNFLKMSCKLMFWFDVYFQNIDVINYCWVHATV